MPYLPNEIPKATVLIAVKTYPFPSSEHGEVVCTAGFLNGSNWVRMYPISYAMYDESRFPKYGWVEVNLVKHPSDSRVESYMPARGLDEEFRLLSRMGTENQWAARREVVQREVFTSLNRLIELSRSEDRSLGTLRPKEIIGLAIEKTSRQWDPRLLERLQQLSFFELDSAGQAKKRQLIRKLPFEFKYRFVSEEDARPREMTIRDWEIGSLFWKCLKEVGDEEEAKRMVRKVYLDKFLAEKDILLFLGTTYEFHMRRVENPFIIVGVFYPPRFAQMPLPLP